MMVTVTISVNGLISWSSCRPHRKRTINARKRARDYVDRDAVLDCFRDWVDSHGDVHTPDEMPEYRAIEALPTVDAVSVVRCRDCRYWKKDHVLDGYTLFKGHMVCTYAIANSFVRHPEDFCSKGEREERDGNE